MTTQGVLLYDDLINLTQYATTGRVLFNYDFSGRDVFLGGNWHP